MRADWVLLGLFLPKADGGARTVSLMTKLTKLWEAVRVDQTHTWKERNDRTYFWAGNARGAADYAWMTGLRAESAYKGPGSAQRAACRTCKKPTITSVPN